MSSLPVSIVFQSISNSNIPLTRPAEYTVPISSIYIRIVKDYMSNVMKAFLYYLLLGSTALATTISASVGPSSISTEDLSSTSTSTAVNLDPVDFDITPGELNDYLHPDAVYTAESIDCADGEPIISEGLTIGCFFLNEREAVNNAIEAISEEKNLTVSLEARSLGNLVAKRRIDKRAIVYDNWHCHQSGVYATCWEMRRTMKIPIANMDSFAGKHVDSASWTITQWVDNLNPPNRHNIYAVELPGTQVKIDYFFKTLKPGDSWVHSYFRGCGQAAIEGIIGVNDQCFLANADCIGGSKRDGRGGWVEVWSTEYPSRHYRIGVDPNPLSGNG